jgi:hypothetical protein
MAEFIFTKEKIIALGETIGMILQKHTIEEVPPTDKELLILIDIGNPNVLLWSVGTWDKAEGWTCSFDEIGYNVVEWYELPPREKIKEDYSYHQMRLEEFWNDK